MTVPLVSVVITTYNTGLYIAETLDSVIAQTHTRLEIIVVDDGSTDDTVARVQPYRSRIQLIEQAHGGLARARNAGLRVASGDFVALLDADDLWLPAKLAVQLEVAARHPESGLVACDGVEFGGGAASGRHLLSQAALRAIRRGGGQETTGDFYKSFLRYVNIRCPAQTLLPRGVVEAIGPFGNFDAQDYDYYLRLSRRFPVTFHAHSLVLWRDRSYSMSGPPARRRLAWSRQRLAVLRARQRRGAAVEAELLAPHVIRARAQLAVLYAETSGNARARRVVAGLMRRRLWPPVGLRSAVELAVPRFARRIRALWRAVVTAVRRSQRATRP